MTTEGDDYDDFIRRALQWRGVDDPCARCGGSGRVAYSSTATWRGGMGGQMITVDVCDVCWGSGDRFRSGCDLRRLRDEESARIARHGVEVIAESVGATFASSRAAIGYIVLALERLADKRGKPPAPHFVDLVRSLADVLRRASKGT